MIKRLKQTAWLILFGCLLTGFGLAVWQASRFPHPPKNPQPYDQSHNTNTNENDSGKLDKSFWERSAEDPVAYFTLWLVAFTGVLAVSTIGLWIVTWRAAGNQSRETEILQRAYIAVAGAGILPLAVHGVAHIVVRNVGNLPARQVSWFISAEVSNDGRRSNFPIDNHLFYGNNVVPPGTEMFRSQNFTVGKSDIQDFRNAESHIYVWGEIRYFDGFGQRRVTRFCHRYNWRGLRRTADPSKGIEIIEEVTAESMRYHQFGNDAD